MERPQLQRRRRSYLFRHERYGYDPTGLLTVRITDNPSFTWHACTWSDGKRRRLESCLHDVMIGFAAPPRGRRRRGESKSGDDLSGQSKSGRAAAPRGSRAAGA